MNYKKINISLLKKLLLCHPKNQNLTLAILGKNSFVTNGYIIIPKRVFDLCGVKLSHDSIKTMFPKIEIRTIKNVRKAIPRTYNYCFTSTEITVKNYSFYKIQNGNFMTAINSEVADLLSQIDDFHFYFNSNLGLCATHNTRGKALFFVMPKKLCDDNPLFGFTFTTQNFIENYLS